MKISHNWLTQFINIPLTTDETSAILTDIGLEVEKLEKKEALPGGLKGVVVGEVLETSQHPNADKLKLTKINIGSKEPLAIVCGAPNVAEKQKVIVATVGTTLYPTEGDAFKIKKSKIRGEESMGMLCAEDEIGIGTGHDGIMILKEEAIPGTPISDYLNMKDDWVYEIGLTPNRSDAMSHWGVARDLVVAMKHKGIIGKDTMLCKPSVESYSQDNNNLPISIHVENHEACPRYVGVTITGVKVDESPEWIKERLLSIGLSPINNIVDITNYVLHELGQPLHAFDASKIKGNKVVVKTTKSETKFTTLDETERSLHEDDLMICNEEAPMCIAGVFGGLTSGVSNETTSIFLESAYFNPVSVRKTAKRHSLNTDASFRFERGIDPNITTYALKRAAMLIKEIAGGEISSEIQESYPTPIKDHTTSFSYKRCNTLIGKEIPTETVDEILSLLDIKTLNKEGDQLTLEVPAFRNDVTREADIIEEILRIYGFNNIDIPAKLNTSIAYSKGIDKDKLKNIVSDLLVNNGFYEMMANSLTKSNYSIDFSGELIDPNNNVKLLNPLSSDLDVLRQSLLFNGLETISYNIKRQIKNIKTFEFGKTYHKKEDKFIEENYLTLFLTGTSQEESWKAATSSVDFNHTKQTLENILVRLGIFKNEQLEETNHPHLTYGLSYSINRKKVADIGLTKQDISNSFDIKQEVYAAIIHWDTVLELMVMNKTKYKPLSKYPSSRRDLSLLLDKSTPFSAIKEIAKKADRKLLKEIGLFDIYQGKNLEEGKKSYAVSFLFRDDEKTLQDKQVDKIMSKIQSELENKLNASLR